MNIKRKLPTILFCLISTFSFGQVVNTVSGIDTTLASGNGYDVSTDTETILIIEKSRFTQTQPGTYLIKCGIDGYNSDFAEKLNGAVLWGNYLSFTGDVNSLHGMMAGYSLDYDIRYNYFDYIGYGVVAEGGYNDGSPMENTSYDIAYNIFNSCAVNWIAIGGYDSVSIYNNTFYNHRDDHYWLLRVDESNGTTVPAISRNIAIRNNIFYTVDNNNMITIKSSCTPGFECDYNIYFCENSVNNEPRFLWGGYVKTWNEWRDLGFDTHSLILDPTFMDTIDFVPMNPLFYGTNLGEEYNKGLSNHAEWIVGKPPELMQQGNKWQVGARVHFTTDLSQSYSNSSKQIFIFPNPFKDILNICCSDHLQEGEYNLSVYNSEGQIVFNSFFFNNGTAQEYDLSTLYPGSYSVSISDGATIIAIKNLVKY